MSYKKIGVFSVFEKIIRRKGKKIFVVSDIIIVSYGHTTLWTQKIKFCMQKKSFFFGKCLFEYKIRFALKKKLKIFLGDFKFQKLYMGLHDKHFFQKKKQKPRFFHHHTVFIRIKPPTKLVHVFFQPFFEIVRKLYGKHTKCIHYAELIFNFYTWLGGKFCGWSLRGGGGDCTVDPLFS